MQTEHLEVTGMSCGGCAGTVMRALKAVNGVIDADVSFAAGEAKVQYDEKSATPGQLKSAIEAAGYGVSAAGIVAPPSKRCCGGNKDVSTPA